MANLRKVVFGIDPGRQGKIVAVSLKKYWISSWSIPWFHKKKGGELDVVEFIRIIKREGSSGGEYEPIVACEWFRPHAINGKLTWFMLGEMFGAIYAACDMAGITLLRVPPKEWQAHQLRKYTWDGREELKQISMRHASLVYPELGPNGFKKNDNLADAALVASYIVDIAPWKNADDLKRLCSRPTG